MKKVYIKPEIELIDLTAKEKLMDDDHLLDNLYGLDIWGDETDVSLPEGWM